MFTYHTIFGAKKKGLSFFVIRARDYVLERFCRRGFYPRGFRTRGVSSVPAEQRCERAIERMDSRYEPFARRSTELLSVDCEQRQTDRFEDNYNIDSSDVSGECELYRPF